MTVPLANWKATHKQKRLVRQVLRSGRLTYGNKTREFEKKFAKLQGWNYALFTSSGTDALKIAIGAMKDNYGWKDGDEVIIPAVTFIATMNVVIMNNLKPVLVDVERASCNIDPELIEKSITKKTRAIIPVHLLGRPADMNKIMIIAKKHKLKVIEDSCEMMGIQYSPHGDMACYSTYLAHLLTTGVGGFITTNDSSLATIMRSMMFHGRDESYLSMDDISDPNLHYSFPRFGYSDRLTELEAALGLGELDDLYANIQTRQDNATIYRGKDVDNHAYMFYPFFVKRERNGLAKYLDEHNIQSRHIMPLTTQPLAKKYLKGNYPSADYINKHGLLLPCHQYLKPRQIRYVLKTIEEFYA